MPAIMTRFIWLWPASCPFLYFGTMLTRWSLRDRWAGALMLDARQPKRKSSIFIFVGITAWVMSDFVEKPSVDTLFGLGSLVWVYALFRLAFESWAEIRQRGLVFMGGLVPWLRIKSFAWGDVKGERVRLVLSVNQPWYRDVLYWRSNFIQLKVLTEEKAAIEAILRRQLAEWPEQMKAPGVQVPS